MARIIILSYFILGAVFSSAGLDLPRLSAPVNDEASLISRAYEQKINTTLRKLKSETGTQIAVALLPDLQGDTIEQFSIALVDKWKLGGAEADRGVLLLVAKKERKIRIEVGQGLEGELTDLESKQIINEVIRPLMQKGQFDDAILLGVAAIVQKTDPNFKFDIPQNQNVGRREKRSRPLWLNILYFLLFIFFISSGRGGIAGLLIGSALGGGRGGFGGGSLGGGGGFSGGGGGFSGGGASGDW